MIRAATNSVASLCVVPLQDALGLGSDARGRVRKIALTVHEGEILGLAGLTVRDGQR